MALLRSFWSLFLERLQTRGRKARRRIILDFDSTDDPVHGAQQLDDVPRLLRPVAVFAASGLRKRIGRSPRSCVRVTLTTAGEPWPSFDESSRGSGRTSRERRSCCGRMRGFASPELYEFCEAAEISYVIGQITNSRLVRKGRPWMKKAKVSSSRPARRPRSSAPSVTAPSPGRNPVGSSPKPRSFPSARTPASSSPTWQAIRLPSTASTPIGEQMENHIKDLKNALLADRLSCQPLPLQPVPPPASRRRLHPACSPCEKNSRKRPWLRLRWIPSNQSSLRSAPRSSPQPAASGSIWPPLTRPDLSGSTSPLAWPPPDAFADRFLPR